MLSCPLIRQKVREDTPPNPRQDNHWTTGFILPLRAFSRSQISYDEVPPIKNTEAKAREEVMGCRTLKTEANRGPDAHALALHSLRGRRALQPSWLSCVSLSYKKPSADFRIDSCD